MGRLSKCIIGIALPLLFLLGQISNGATITGIKMEEKEEKGSGETENWKVTNYYIKELKVLRTTRGEAFVIEVPSKLLLRGWQDHYRDDKVEVRIENRTKADHNGINIFYSEALNVDNYRIENYQVLNYTAQGNRVMMTLKSISDNKNNNRPTLNGKKMISVPSSVPDGDYNVVSTVLIGRTAKSHSGKLEIRTLPTISVEDIDFGNYPLDGKKIKAEKRSPIFIIGGSPNQNFKLTIEGVGGVHTSKKDVTISLTNPNTEKVIKVKLSIEGLKKDIKLNSEGNNLEGSIKAKINEKKGPTVGGIYSGRAKVIFQYD